MVPQCNMLLCPCVYNLWQYGHLNYRYQLYFLFHADRITGWERTGQMLCIVDTSLSVLMTLKMCLRELCCLFTVWI